MHRNGFRSGWTLIVLAGIVLCLGSTADWHRGGGPTLLSAVASPGSGEDGGIESVRGKAMAGGILPLRGDPSFDPDDLPTDQRIWYDRLLLAIDDSRGTIDSRASSRDLYYTGRTVGDYNAALLMAVRATGDISLLDRVAEVSEMYRAQLADAWLDGTTDGYLNWVWLIDENNSTYYGNDLHQLDEVITHGNVALVAYAFHLNRDLDPSYDEKANFWTSYLENHFLPKWYGRSGHDPVTAWEATEDDPGNALYRRFPPPRTNQMRLGYYLWQITGNDFYQDRADSASAELFNHLQINPDVPTAYRWKRQLRGSDLGWQPINYAQYFLGGMLEMHLEGFGGFEQAGVMERITSTFVDVVLPAFGPPYSRMAYRVDGSEETDFWLYNTLGLARWDETGFLLARAEEKHDATSSLGRVSIAAFALMALSDRVTTSIPEEGDSDQGSILAFPSPNPTSGFLTYSLNLETAARVRLDVFDVAGERVAKLLDRHLESGRHQLSSNLNDLPDRMGAGVYFLTLEAGPIAEVRKLILTR